MLTIVVLVALAAPVAASAKLPKQTAGHTIDVLQSGGEGKPIATFRTARCRVTSNGFFAKATSTDGGYKLQVAVHQFHGFGAAYQLELGASIATGTVVSFSPKGGAPFWDNSVKPPFPVPGFGDVLFRQGGRLMGVGFGPAMFASSTKEAVTLSGVVQCVYAKKGKH